MERLGQHDRRDPRPANGASIRLALIALSGLVSVIGAAAETTPLLPDAMRLTPFEPRDLACADLDGDGHVDLVVPGWDSSEADILLGNGDGTFESRPVAGLYAFGVTIGDFNEDGVPDLAFTSSFDVAVLLGHGDGTFEPERRFPTNDYPTYVTNADFDEDGHLDLAVVYIDRTSFDVLPGHGDGTFGEPGGDYGAATYAIATGDFDADGHADIVTGFVYLGRGDGTFVRADTGPLFGSYSIGAVQVDDLNFDGYDDIVVAEGGEVWIGYGDAAGIFSRRVQHALPADSVLGVAIDDFDADGRLDLAIGHYYDAEVSLLFGQANGSFEAPISVVTPHNNGRLVGGDFDRDGHRDLALASFQNDTLSLLFGAGDGSFTTPGRRDFALGEDPRSVTLADFDEDGLIDAAGANRGSHDVTVRFGDGDGNFFAPRHFPVGQTPSGIVSGDLDEDGHVDVVVANADSADGSVLLGVGDGTFASEYRFALGSAVDLAIGDLDHDGHQDVAAIFGPPDDALRLFYGDGAGALVGSPPVQVGAEPSALTLEDLDGDGIDDAVVANAGSADLSVVRGNVNREIPPERRFPVGVGLLSGVAVADLDGDGLPDVVLAGRRSVVLRGLRTEDSWALGPDEDLGSPLRSWHVAVGDVDGDRRPDVAVTNATAKISVLINDGDGRFEDTSRVYATRWFAHAVEIDDFDRDGRNDVLLIDSGDILSVLINEGPAVLGFTPDGTVLGWPRSREALAYHVYRGLLSGLVDSDGDGLPDRGLGSCQDDRDPDLTDNDFADLEPPPPGDGFFYLVVVEDAGGHGDLGTTSEGLPRQPAVACP